jgi:hypothetical protein
MEILKKIMMMASCLFSIICFVASAWMAYSLPNGDPNVKIFAIFAVIFFAATIWFGFNVRNLNKEGK